MVIAGCSGRHAGPPMSVSCAPRAVARTRRSVGGVPSTTRPAPHRRRHRPLNASSVGEPRADADRKHSALLDAKVRRTQKLFRELLPPSADLEVYPSPKAAGFRNRCRFAIVREEEVREQGDEGDEVSEKHEKSRGALRYALFEKGKVEVLNTESPDFFPAASDAVADLMPRLLRYLHEVDKDSTDTNRNPLTTNLSAVGFLANRAGDVIVTLWNSTGKQSDTNTKEDEASHEDFERQWDQAACLLVDELQLTGLVSRRKGHAFLSSNGDDTIVEKMTVPKTGCVNDSGITQETLQIQMVEGAFSNPNPDVAEITAAWLRETVLAAFEERLVEDEGNGKDFTSKNSKNEKTKFSLVELYCGNGTHTVNLSPLFHSVVAVEIEPRLCNACEENFRLNGIQNATVKALPAETFSKRKTKPKQIDDFILVDPPRNGLDPVTLTLVQSYRTILYIACDSRSLVRDLQERGLAVSHEIKRIAVFDHFPKSVFCEVVVRLERRRETRRYR